MDDEGAGLVEVAENCAAVKLPRPKLGLLADQQIITMMMMVMAAMIYIYYDEVSVCHKKIITSELSARGAK